MSCCSSNTKPINPIVDSPESLVQENSHDSANDSRAMCPHCGISNRSVSRKTIYLMLRPAFFSQVVQGEYSFCDVPTCPVVYFHTSSGQVFAADALRVTVGLKQAEDPIPLCYCFG